MLTVQWPCRLRNDALELVLAAAALEQQDPDAAMQVRGLPCCLHPHVT